ncbi:MAG: hypothetical protein NVS9B1_05390 [Candidatus Dormibacteraceae bacterium]
MPAVKFIRIVQRERWDVELMGTAKRQSFASREEAVSFAVRNEPEWIEVGEETLHRRTDGTYESMHGKWHAKA